MRRVGLVLAVLAVGIAGSCATAAAKPVVYPVKITIKLKSTVFPPDSPWWEIAPPIAEGPALVRFGQIASPKAACERNRPLISVFEVAPMFIPEVDRRTGISSDSTGSWEDVPFPDQPEGSYRDALRKDEIRQRVKVARKALGGGRFCAEAISRYLAA